MAAVLGTIAAVAVTADDVSKAITAIEDAQVALAALAMVLPVLQAASQIIASQQASGSEIPTADQQAQLTNQEQGAYDAAQAAIDAEAKGGN